MYYDHGWNDRIDGKPCAYPNNRDYRDGWRDCDEATDADRETIGKI